MVARTRSCVLWLGAGLLLVACQRPSPAPEVPPGEAPPASSSSSASSCPGGMLCVSGLSADGVCLYDDGAIPTGGAQCRVGQAAQDCGPGRSCLVVSLPEGSMGLCQQTCSVSDDRPACAPGCYNQLCSDRLGVCARQTGACRPVSCSSDADCIGLEACDYPGRSQPGFRCNTSVGACERDRSQP